MPADFFTTSDHSCKTNRVKEHTYHVETNWTGNRGTGTDDYRTYSRDHVINVPGKPAINGSSDPAFRGDNTRYNPEELFVGSLSTFHMLWYLHLCADAGVVVTNYVDHAEGKMQESNDGGGRFTEVILRPEVTITDAALIERARALHAKANSMCFIANSCNFPVQHHPVIRSFPDSMA